MVFSQLQESMATLRLSLADMQNRERQLDHVIAQVRTPLQRLPMQVIYVRTSLDASLSALGEIEERLAYAVASRRRLLTIKKTATEELEALEVVKRVDEARRSLQELRQGTNPSEEEPETLAEVRRLEQFIAENSKLAEWAITASYQEREER